MFLAVIKIYLHRNGRNFGPYSVESIRKQLKSGKFAKKDWACTKGAKEWIRLSDLIKIGKTEGLTGIESLELTEEQVVEYSQKPKHHSVQGLIDLYGLAVLKKYNSSGNIAIVHQAVKDIVILIQHTPYRLYGSMFEKDLKWYKYEDFQTTKDLRDFISSFDSGVGERLRGVLSNFNLSSISERIFDTTECCNLFDKENLLEYEKSGLVFPNKWIPLIEVHWMKKCVALFSAKLSTIPQHLLEKSTAKLDYYEVRLRDGAKSAEEKKTAKLVSIINEYRLKRMEVVKNGKISFRKCDLYLSNVKKYKDYQSIEEDFAFNFSYIKKELSRFFYYSIESDCHVLGTYYPMKSTRGSSCGFSKMIIGLKNKNQLAIENFLEFFAPLKLTETVIVGVPSSKPAENSGIRILALQIGKMLNCKVLSGLLKRTREMPKKALGGERDHLADLNSLELIEPERFEGRNVLLIDDIITTGTTMDACEKMLVDYTNKIFKVAIGKTDFKNNVLISFGKHNEFFDEEIPF